MKPQTKIYWQIGKVVALGLLAVVVGIMVLQPGQAALAQPALPGTTAGQAEALTPCMPPPLATIPVGSEPRGVAVDASRNRVYVANYGSDSVSVIDNSSNTVINTISPIPSANGIAYDGTNNIIWVTNFGSNTVTPIQANGTATSFTVLPSIPVGSGPWGVAYDPVHNFVYVVNNSDSSVTVINAATKAVLTTLSGTFAGPFYVAANPLTGKAYVANFIGNSVTVLNGAMVSHVVDLTPGIPTFQPYGVAVDETRNLVYVATVQSHRIVVLGNHPEKGPDQKLGWAEFYRGFGGDRSRPLPMRAIAINPDIGPVWDGGHVWATTAVADGSQFDQVLLIPKGWTSYFHYATARNLPSSPGEGIAIDRNKDRVYVSSSAAGVVTVWEDSTTPCLSSADAEDDSQTNFGVFTDDGTPVLEGDLNQDGYVDIFDLAVIASSYGSDDPAADVNGDGKVDILDLTIVANSVTQGG